MMYSLFYLWHSLLWMSHAFIKTCAVLKLSSTTTMEIVLKRKKRKSSFESAPAPEAERRQSQRRSVPSPVLLGAVAPCTSQAPPAHRAQGARQQLFKRWHQHVPASWQNNDT